MKYYLAFKYPTEQLISVKVASIGTQSPVIFHLPKWRPGRYELQRFDRRVTDVSAVSGNGRPLRISRLTTHSWEVEAAQGEVFFLQYAYYADVLDGGGSYFDKDRIYVNGINLLMYREELLDEPCELFLNLPGEGYEVACGLPKVADHWLAKDFHQLVDAPFLAGRDLQHHVFDVKGVKTHLWFQGECQPDFRKLEKEFRAYSEAQIALFGEFPVPEYHYLVVVRPDLFRHGVEHYNSTVIAIGPGHRLSQKELHRAFLEVCSHELFHTWNVKAIRPKEMLPYDYGQENYSRLHYMTEGVTTYYGDLMIWKGGGWKLSQWLNSLNGVLKRFYFRGGKDTISLSQASMESWINAYNLSGAPNRQISFYVKGSLVTFLMDIEIRRLTRNEYAFDDVMHALYHDFAKKGMGYGEADVKNIIAKLTGQDFSDFFDRYIDGTTDLEPALQAAGTYIGLELFKEPFESLAIAFWGMEVNEKENPLATIENVYPNSPALQAGLSKGDEIISLNGQKVNGNLEQLIQYYGADQEIEIHFFHLGKLHKTQLARQNYFRYIPQFVEVPDPTRRQLENRFRLQQVKEQKHMQNQLIK